MKILKSVLFLLLFVTAVPICNAQQTKDSLIYHPGANAKVEIEKARVDAYESGRHVLIIAGGNWCKWCRLFDKWSHENRHIDSLITADFVVVHLNYSKENKNPEVMKSLGYPQRFGFPVFIVMDGKGNRLHTQNTGYLEQEDGYSETKVAEFLSQWSRGALDDEQYKKDNEK